jgi:hypothetical protein
LKAHSILANTLRELKVWKHFLPEAPLKIPMECSLVDTAEDYSENLASEAHIEPPGSWGLVQLYPQLKANLKKLMLVGNNVTGLWQDRCAGKLLVVVVVVEMT